MAQRSKNKTLFWRWTGTSLMTIGKCLTETTTTMAKRLNLMDRTLKKGRAMLILDLRPPKMGRMKESLTTETAKDQLGGTDLGAEIGMTLLPAEVRTASKTRGMKTLTLSLRSIFQGLTLASARATSKAALKPMAKSEISR